MSDIEQYKNVTIALNGQGNSYEAVLCDDSEQIYLWAADIAQAIQLAKQVIDNKTELKLSLAAACYQLNIASSMYPDSKLVLPLD